MTIKQYINSISKRTCPPNMCRDRQYSNGKEVVHWIFNGDGVNEYEERANDATVQTVKEYITHCQNQIMLAHEYLSSLDGASSGDFLLAISGMFDSSIKAESDLIVASIRLKSYKWMEERVDDAIHDKNDELLRFNQVNTTMLAEECVYESGIWPEHLHTEILDNETHWIWDLAVDVAEAYDQNKLGTEP